MLKPKALLARRRLVATVFVLGVLAAVSFVSNLGTVAQVGSTSTVVGIAQTKDDLGNVVEHPTEVQIDAAVRQAVELAGGLPANVGPGKKIVIQPNLVEAGWNYNDPLEEGVCTHRQVVRTLVHMCLEAGAEIENITICEGSAAFHGDLGGYSSRQATRKAFKDVGLDLNGDMVEDQTGAALVDANNVGMKYPDYPGYSGPYNPSYVTHIIRSDYLITREYYIPNCVAQCDVFIRVPVLKNHDLAGLTGGLKLGFGIAPSDIYHAFWLDNMKWNLLHQTVWGYDELYTNARGMADMNLARRPDMVVVDGLVGIMSGPTRIPSGKSEPDKPDPYMSCIIAGLDVVAVDTITALAEGYRVGPDSIPSIGYAYAKGLGTNNPAVIQVRGAHVVDIRRWFPDNYGAARRGDGTPPVLTQLSVSEGAHVCGRLAVSPLGAYDSNPGLCKAELYVDGVLVDSQFANGFITSWDAGGAAEGAHTITYILYDGMLNETSISRTVYVHNGDPIAGALDIPDGTAASVGPVYVTGLAPAINGRTFFVSSADGVRGLRVEYFTTPVVTVGQEVTLYGTMGTAEGQRYLQCSSYAAGAGASASADIKAKLFRNRALGGADRSPQAQGVYKGTGPYNLGCLVKTVGKVSAGGSDYFWIDDGSLTTDAAGAAKLKVQCGSFAQPAPGSYVSVVGFSCSEDDGGIIRRMLVARSESEIAAY